MPVWTYNSLKYGGSGTPAFWKPSDSPGLSDWFTASYTPSVTTPNGNVTSWTTRRSGGTNNLVTLTGTPTHDGNSINFLNGNHSLADTSIDNGAITNGSCMLYVVCDTNKAATHYICGYDINNGAPGLALRYWQPTNSWFAYCDSVTGGANVSQSAAGTAANQKVLLGVRVNGTVLSMSVNGNVTIGGVAAVPFTATRFGINQNPTRTSLGRVYDIESFTTYDEGTALRIEGELAYKHGITLPAGHPYRLSPPTLEWIPTDDSGLTIWYDFADSSTITVTGAGISDLKNKKNPATYNLTQSTDASRPTWNGSTATGRTASSGLSVTTSVGWTNAAYQILSSTAYGNNTGNLSREYAVLDAGLTATYHRRGPGQSANNVDIRANNASGTTGEFSAESGYAAEASLNLRGVYFNGQVSGQVYSWKNGTSTVGSSGANVNPVTGGVFRLFHSSSDNVTLGDFLVTTSTDTATRQRLEGYLAWKRGLQSSLPSGHPYRTKKPIYQEWTPADDASCIIWYDFADASTITVTGAGISQITNKVPGGTFTLVQATDADRPSWDGSFATGRSTGTGLVIPTTVNWTNAAYSAFLVAKATDFNVSQYRMFFRVMFGVSVYHCIYAKPTSNALRQRSNSLGTGAGEVDILSGYTAGQPYLITHTFNGTTTKGSYVNGGSALTDTSANNGPVIGDKFGLLQSGDGHTLGDFIVTSATSTAIRQKYEGWLAWKRGIASSLPSDHPYKSRPPLTTD